MIEIYSRRIWSLVIIFTLLFFIIFLRLFYLQILRYDFYIMKGLEQRTRLITLAADRGDVFDAEGELLATSIDTKSIFLVPSAIGDREKTAEFLSKILKKSKREILLKMQERKPFVWLERKVTEVVARKIKEGNFPGVLMLSEKKRVYPKGKLSSQVLGFVGVDNQGLEGIELSFDSELKGKEGKLLTESDPRGWEILTAKVREIQPETEGLNITLTIDETIQYIAEKELKRAISEHQAKQGVIIVMNPKTGEIYAIASKPDFDPNNWSIYDRENWHARATSDVYEPGSTFKLITIAAALEEGIIGKNTKVFCRNSIKVGDRIIKNSAKLPHGEGFYSITEILSHSINTGAAQIGMKLGKESLMKYIKSFGFGEPTRVGLPGETKGIVRETTQWAVPDIAMISFGQGIAVTPLQMLSAVSTIANGGRRVKPLLIRKIESTDKSYIKVFPTDVVGQVISDKTAGELIKMMEDVVEAGTGKLAKIANFRVGGKTGTAQKVRPDGSGYWAGHYIPSFVGVVPASSPELAILVIIDDPKGIYWGERIAAPVFKRVAEETLRYLNIAPDKLASL